MRPKRNCCGNARRHRCRSLFKAARGPWKCRARGKRGKPKAGFPLFPPALENLAKTARFSHFHRPGVGRLGKWKTSPRFSTFPPGPRDDDDEFLLFKPKPKKGSRPLRGLLVLFTPLSLRSSGRAEPRFHAHPSIGKCLQKKKRSLGRVRGAAPARADFYELTGVKSACKFERS